MKRISAILSLALILVLMTASFCFAAGFDLESSYPADGDDNKSIDNFSIKLYFNDDVLNEANEAANAKCIKVTDPEGNEIPMQLFYSPNEKGLVMALADIDVDDELQISEDTEYTVVISGDFQNAAGDTLGEDKVITFKTLNQSRSMTVYMVIMVVMFGGMFYFSNKAMKKQKEKEKQEYEKVNPYKKAKETGKSVEEIVAREQKAKAKRARAEARKAAKDAGEEFDDEDDDELYQINPDAKRVKGPRPIAAGGSTYITGRKAQAEEARKAAMQKGTTKPKNKSGKHKNKK